MENFVLLRIPVCDIYMCVCCTFITQRVHGRSYGFDLKKKGNGSLSMKKTAADSKVKGKKPGSMRLLG